MKGGDFRIGAMVKATWPDHRRIGIVVEVKPGYPGVTTSYKVQWLNWTSGNGATSSGVYYHGEVVTFS